jgi:two-component system C4-dicarboxylate transport sensor histidine kinase DctB
VRADEVLLQQVFVNLIGNALQAVQGLDRRQVRIVAAQRPADVQIMVEDSGPGIADEHLGQVFEPFFTTKSDTEGLGLGLTISCRIIEELGGRMVVGRGMLGGAVFQVSLPTANADSQQSENRSRI